MTLIRFANFSQKLARRRFSGRKYEKIEAPIFQECAVHPINLARRRWRAIERSGFLIFASQIALVDDQAIDLGYFSERMNSYDLLAAFVYFGLSLVFFFHNKTKIALEQKFGKTTRRVLGFGLIGAALFKLAMAFQVIGNH